MLVFWDIRTRPASRLIGRVNRIPTFVTWSATHEHTYFLGFLDGSIGKFDDRQDHLYTDWSAIGPNRVTKMLSMPEDLIAVCALSNFSILAESNLYPLYETSTNNHLEVTSVIRLGHRIFSVGKHDKQFIERVY